VSYLINNEPDQTVALRLIKSFPESIKAVFDNEMKTLLKAKKGSDKREQHA
jgi:DNA-binding XRE family transcriptional regulator